MSIDYRVPAKYRHTSFDRFLNRSAIYDMEKAKKSGKCYDDRFLLEYNSKRVEKISDDVSYFFLIEYYYHIKDYEKLNEYSLMFIKLEYVKTMKMEYFLALPHANYDVILKPFFHHNNLEIIHFKLRHLHSILSKEIIRELEKNNFLGVKIFKELTEYCFNPQRLTKLCNIYNIEMSDYMDII